MHMSQGLAGTNTTSLKVVTVSASVKQQHYDSMFASMEQRHMISKINKIGIWKKHL